MQPALRRLVAFIAGTAIEGQHVEGVFDFEIGSRYPISGEVDGVRVDVRDETDEVRLRGTLPYLAQDGGTALELHLEDDEFTGLDHATGAPFHGRVAGRNIDLTDEETGEIYTYCL